MDNQDLETLAGFRDEYSPRRSRLIELLSGRPVPRKCQRPIATIVTGRAVWEIFGGEYMEKDKDQLRHDLNNERTAANLAYEMLAQWYEEFGSKGGRLAENTLAVLDAARREGRIE